MLMALGVVVGVGAGVVSLPASAPAAGADPMSDCTTTTGVVVVVDLTAFGGNVERGCAAAPSDGLAALGDAGFTTTPVSGEPGFVCRIDGEPSPSQQACVSTPPATAYWSYWYADAGQSTWSQWQLGAASSHPLPGSVDAWAFGSGRPPSVPPSAVRATTPGPTPPTVTTTTTPAGATTASTPASTGPPAPGGASASPPGSEAASSGSSAATGRRGAGASSPPTTVTAPPSAAASGHGGAAGEGGSGQGSPQHQLSRRIGTRTASARATPRIVDVTPATARRAPAAGSPVAAVVGGIVVVALAGAGGVLARRRRVRTQ